MGNGLMCIYLGVLGLLDVRSRQIPVVVLIFGSIWAAGRNLLQCIREPAQMSEIIRFSCAGLLPGILVLLFAVCSGQMGTGDGWVVLNVGLYGGWRIALMTLGLGLFLMTVSIPVMLCLRLLHKRPHGKLPCLPFFALSYLIGCCI